jgi:ribonuclease BN (tRNA processing enzyme)
VQLTVLGCSGTFPGPDSPCSGYLIEHEGYRLVVDLGAGALGNLQKHCDVLDIDAVYITHLHADHCIDLVAYSYARRFHPSGIPPKLPVYGPEGSCARICNSFEEAPVNGLLDVYDFQERGVGIVQLGPLTVTVGLMEHPIECHGLRIEGGGRVLTYSADTANSATLVELARDADVLLCEASWPHVVPGQWDEPPPGLHLSGRQAGEHAKAAGVGRLLLTHVPAWYDAAALLAEAREAFDGPVELVSADAAYEI